MTSWKNAAVDIQFVKIAGFQGDQEKAVSPVTSKL